MQQTEHISPVRALLRILELIQQSNSLTDLQHRLDADNTIAAWKEEMYAD